MRDICRQRLTRPAGRPGAILICVLACLVIVTAMVTAIIRSALRSHVEVRRERQLRQTELMLEAGIMRAHQQVAANPDYEGEIWQLADQTLGTPATIKITSQDEGGFHSIKVTARIGAQLQQQIQRSYEFTHTESPSKVKPADHADERG